MSALQKLKAYFGMLPADDMDEYEDDYSGYGSAYEGEPDLDTYSDRIGARRRPLGTPRPVSRLDPSGDYEERLGRRPWVAEAPHRTPTTAATVAPVRGALAVETQPEVRPRPTPAPQPEPA